MTTTGTTATTAGTAATIQEFFRRFGAGDLAGLLELFASDVDVNVAGADIVPWTGHRTTRDQVAEFFRVFQESVRTEKFDVERVAVDGDDGIVLGYFAHEVVSTGRIFEGPFAIRIGVSDGLIRRYHMFEDSYAASSAFTRSG